MTIRIEEDVHSWIMALKEGFGVKTVSETLRRALKQAYPNIEELAREVEERQRVLAQMIDKGDAES